MKDGSKKKLWCTFGAQQIDIDPFSKPGTPALSCPALPCPALPCPALPCISHSASLCPIVLLTCLQSQVSSYDVCQS